MIDKCKHDRDPAQCVPCIVNKNTASYEQDTFEQAFMNGAVALADRLVLDDPGETNWVYGWLFQLKTDQTRPPLGPFTRPSGPAVPSVVTFDCAPEKPKPTRAPGPGTLGEPHNTESDYFEIIAILCILLIGTCFGIGIAILLLTPSL